MPTRDNNGRDYARLSKLEPGDVIEVDNDFTCINGGTQTRIHAAADGALYFACREGGHLLDGQLDSRSDALIGVYGPL